MGQSGQEVIRNTCSVGSWVRNGWLHPEVDLRAIDLKTHSAMHKNLSHGQEIHLWALFLSSLTIFQLSILMGSQDRQ